MGNTYTVLMELCLNLVRSGILGDCSFDALSRRADLRSNYFLWVDEIGDVEKSMGAQERLEESRKKTDPHLGAHCSNEDVMKISKTMAYMAQELKFIRKLMHGICVGFGVLNLVVLLVIEKLATKFDCQ
ncbi:hypothetical protein PIB30_063576 [Stylosanthes scabra]|uniref:Uncharacterized protein n=1 Tax=Stylosanthes scabra TaxID=79078 RepID=A0ABU6YKB8_9FABA|nr:hypothetical protein [Stylosanthes scabra]